MNELLQLVLGAIAGVAATELWRYLRPPMELHQLRRILNLLQPESPPASGISIGDRLRQIQADFNARLLAARTAQRRASWAHSAALVLFFAAVLAPSLGAPGAVSLAAAAAAAGCLVLAQALLHHARRQKVD